MNNWTNPDAPGTPRFPDITRSHFLRYIAEPTGIENAPAHVMRDAVLPAIWSADQKEWCVLGEYPTLEEMAENFEYISPCYTEAEMRQARLDTFDVCYEICDRFFDVGAEICARNIQDEKDKI